MKVLLAFDSYKGSLSSWEAGNIAARAIRGVVPNAECVVLPLADGGEGTVESVVRATGGTYEHVTVTGPMGAIANAHVGLIEQKGKPKLAVLEVANLCGLTMVGEAGPNPLVASSVGVGEAILQLLQKGIRDFVIGLGGSATNDGGMGMLAALGAEFYDEKGKKLAGSGGDLLHLASVQIDHLDERLAKCRFIVATDVSNPLCGPQGATMIYGRQKGVTSEFASKLDKAMQSYAYMLKKALAACDGHPVVDKPAALDMQEKSGAGAAGGLGFALLVLGGEIVSGAEYISSLVGLDEHVKRMDWVLTGEGRSDRQTLYGKLPQKVAEASKKAGVGCILVSGSLGDDVCELESSFEGCFSIVKEPAELSQCIAEAEVLLEKAVREIFRLIHFVSNERKFT